MLATITVVNVLLNGLNNTQDMEVFNDRQSTGGKP